MRWNLILKSAWHDLTIGRGRWIWWLVTLLFGSMVTASETSSILFTSREKLTFVTDDSSLAMAWFSYPFGTVLFLITTLTLIYNYQNKVVMRELLAGLTRSEFLMRQYVYIAFIALSQILFFFILYFIADGLVRLWFGNMPYEYTFRGMRHRVFEEFVSAMFLGSVFLFSVNLFRSYFLILAFFVLQLLELILQMKFSAEASLEKYLNCLPLYTLKAAFGSNFSSLATLLSACGWVCLSIVGNAFHWAKRSIK